jgi:hypothetical protein
MHYLHYPVRDFGAVPAESLKRLVVELKRRILEGHTVYVHCRGGHGYAAIHCTACTEILFHFLIKFLVALRFSIFLGARAWW